MIWKNRKVILAATMLMAAITIISVVITVKVVWDGNNKPVLPPDYALPEIEKNANPIENEDDTQKLEQPKGGGAVSLIFSKDVMIDCSSYKAVLLFANPAKSNQRMILQIKVHDTVIAMSGMIDPGLKIETLDLLGNAELQRGQYEGKFVVFFYQPDSGERSILNTEIPINIIVN